MTRIYLLIAFLLGAMITHAQMISTLSDIQANGGISVDDHGQILVAHFGPLPLDLSTRRSVFKITPEGQISIHAANAVLVGSGNDIDGNGFLYQADFASSVIVKLDSNGTVINPSHAAIAGPVGVLAKEDGTLFVCSCNSNIIHEVKPGGTVSNFAMGNFNCANGITSDADNNLYVTSFSNGVIRKISADGIITEMGDTGAGNGHIVYRPVDKFLYITSYSSNKIFRMDLDGNVSLFAGTGAEGTHDAEDLLQATFTRPNGIAITKNSCSLYITQDENVLREIKFFDGRCDRSTGTRQLNSRTPLKVYPNPSHAELIWENPAGQIAETMHLLDYTGLPMKASLAPGNSVSLVDVPAGAYTLVIEWRSGARSAEPVVVQH